MTSDDDHLVYSHTGTMSFVCIHLQTNTNTNYKSVELGGGLLGYVPSFVMNEFSAPL